MEVILKKICLFSTFQSLPSIVCLFPSYSEYLGLFKLLKPTITAKYMDLTYLEPRIPGSEVHVCHNPSN